MQLDKNTTFRFVLYKEKLIYGAIANDILRRAYGLSHYQKVIVMLIDCSNDFEAHARRYMPELNIETLNEQEVKQARRKYLDDIIITHTWPDTLFKIRELFPNSHIILIEEIPPLFDRIPDSRSHQPLLNRIMTSRPTLHILTRRYRKAILNADAYVAISDYEAEVLINKYGWHAHFTAYEPVDTRYFRFVDGNRNSILVFGSVKENQKIIKAIVDSGAFPNLSEVYELLSGKDTLKEHVCGLKVNHLDSYDFETISKLYERAVISIVPEWKGSFELIPVESIASGVPVISPLVPSLMIVKSLMIDVPLKGIEGWPFPFFDYQEIKNVNESDMNKREFERWLSSVDLNRKRMSDIARSTFGIDVVAKEFNKNLEAIMGNL